MDLQQFFDGKAFDAYEYFGAHATDNGYIFRVYAPSAKSVSVIGEFNDWNDSYMIRANNGIWEITVPEAEEGQMYKYRVEAQNGKITDKADPYGTQMEVRPNSASIINSLKNFNFTDKEWLSKRKDTYNSPMSIYECHLGSWKQKGHDEEDEPIWYNYRELADLLIPYLKENHFTHVEFLPLNEHPFDGSWGYQASGFFSVTSRYGTPQDFMYLVNECHKNNIGVIMDFVVVHFTADDYGLREFDGTALYEYDNTSTGYNEWGSCNFNYFRHEVCSFLMSAANIWLDKFHVDGLRMDAINNALYWQGNKDRGVNIGAINFLREMNSGLHKMYNGIMLIAEDSSNFLKVTAPVEYEGLGFDYKWDLGWMNDTLEYFKLYPTDREARYHQLSFSMMYFWNELYILPFSHDEVVHGKATIIQKMWGDYEYKFPQCRTLYVYMFTHPGKKLNFVGNEIGHFREWDEKEENDWFLLKYPKHDSFNRFFKALNEVYVTSPALYHNEYNSENFRWLEIDAPEDCVYAYQRSFGEDIIITVMNTSADLYEDYTIGADEPFILEEVINTDSYEYSGNGLDNKGKQIKAVAKPYKEHDFSFNLRLAPFSSSILRVKGKDKAQEKVTKPNGKNPFNKKIR